MKLTEPITAEEMAAVYPRDTRGMETTELESLVRLEERVLRSMYGVTSTRPAHDLILRDAMIAAWPSFIQQIRNVATETAGANSHTVTFNRSGGSGHGSADLTFPSFIGNMLASIVDPNAQPNTITQLVR
jgi:hypothetical protein